MSTYVDGKHNIGVDVILFADLKKEIVYVEVNNNAKIAFY